jgi:hypothetical protein
MRSLRTLLISAAVLVMFSQAMAQNIIELRGANTKYRYADWNYTFKNSVVADLFYVGVPGSNEFNLGGGYAFKLGKWTVNPLLYAVLGKEGSQRGVKMALLVMFEKDGWKLNSFLAHYARLSGEVQKYQVLDTLDFSKVVGKRWEIGISNGFFHADGKWNPQVGPLLKLNDKWGSWGVSYRFGPQKEFRATRLFAF